MSLDKHLIWIILKKYVPENLSSKKLKTESNSINKDRTFAAKRETWNQITFKFWYKIWSKTYRDQHEIMDSSTGHCIK